MIAPFALERYFDRYEFSAPHLLSSSDCEAVSLSDLLSWMSPQLRARWEAQTLSYTPTQGDPALRAEICALYEQVEPEQLLVGAPEECIYIAMRALLEPDDHLICTWPGYQSLYEVARAIGCEVSFWSPQEEHAWRFDPAQLQELARPNTKMLVINFPHNPTGALPSHEDQAAIFDWAKAQNVRIFSDEMYRLLEQDPQDRLRAAVDLDPSAITLFGMSKSFGLAGLRLGWLATRDEAAMERLRLYKDYTTICSPGPSELLALAGLQARQTLLDRHRARIQRNLELLDGFFERHPERLSWSRPKAGPIGLARLHKETASSFCERAVQEAGVMLLPSTVYDFGDQHIRLGFGRESLPQALSKLEAHLA